MTTASRKACRLGAILAAIFLIVACSKTGDAPSPLLPAAAEFAGSSACEQCHVAEYRHWLGSHHQLAMANADRDAVLGNFGDVEFDYYGETTWFLTDDDEFVVRTANASGQTQDFPVVYTFGVEPLQQYLVELPGGRLQALPFAWDSRSEEQGGQRWFHIYPDEHIAPGEALHWTGRQHNWNYMCAECVQHLS